VGQECNRAGTTSGPDLEHDATGVVREACSAPSLGRPIKVSRTVHCESCRWVGSVGAASEIMQHSLIAIGIQFKDDTTGVLVTGPVRTAEVSSAIQVAGRISHQRPTSRLLPVYTIGERTERVKHSFGPASVRLRRQLKDGATARDAALLAPPTTPGCSIEVSLGVEKQNRARIRSVPALEGVEHRSRCQQDQP
jgi:hypothetical protein